MKTSKEKASSGDINKLSELGFDFDDSGNVIGFKEYYNDESSTFIKDAFEKMAERYGSVLVNSFNSTWDEANKQMYDYIIPDFRNEELMDALKPENFVNELLLGINDMDVSEHLTDALKLSNNDE